MELTQYLTSKKPRPEIKLLIFVLYIFVFRLLLPNHAKTAKRVSISLEEIWYKGSLYPEFTNKLPVISENAG